MNPQATAERSLPKGLPVDPVEALALRLGFDIRQYDQCRDLDLRGWYHVLRDRARLRAILAPQEHMPSDGRPANPAVRLTRIRRLLRGPCRWTPLTTLARPPVRTASCIEELQPHQCVVIIDRRCSRATLERAFASWVRGAGGQPARAIFTPARLRRWHQHRVLAALDLDLLAAAAGRHLSHRVMSRLLFPDSRDGDPRLLVRQRVRPLARQLTEDRTLDAMAAELSECR